MLTVEPNVTIPDTRTRTEAFYPWLKMSVGDSFLTETVAQSSAAKTAFRRWQMLGKIPANHSCISRKEGNAVRFWLVDHNIKA